MTEDVIIKTDLQIAGIAAVCRYNPVFFQELKEYIKPGLSTMDLENFACAFADRYQLIPAFKTVPGYKHALCVSINEEVVHGIPSKKKIIKDGDIVSVDVGFIKNGYISDSAYTYMVGNVSAKARQLCEVTKKSLDLAIAVIKPGTKLGDIGHAIQSYVEPQGFSVVREYVGHGVGLQLHEPPAVYHYGEAGTGLELKKGMVLTVEPMINEGVWQTAVLANGWTVVTKDRKLSAQYEHTIAVTEDGYRVLTA